MSSIKKIGLVLCAVLWVFAVGFFSFADGDENEADFAIPVPEELSGYLPHGVENFGASDLLKSFDFKFFSGVGVRILSEAAPDAAKSFALLLGLLILSATLGVVRRLVTGQGLQVAMELVSLICLASAVFSVTETAFSLAQGYVSSVAAYMRRITPVMSAFMIASGQISSAAVMSGVIFTAVTLLESVVASVLFPLIRLSLCLSLVTSIFGIAGLSGIAPVIKKTISYILGFVTLCLSAVLLFQNLIAKSTDSLALRGIKFAVGQFVPFVGGAVNEALSTMMGGVAAIKASAGVVGAVVVCLLAAVPVIRILLHKTFLEWVSICAGILGLGGEGKLLTEVASFLGYTAAVMAISAVFFVLSLSFMASV